MLSPTSISAFTAIPPWADRVRAVGASQAQATPPVQPVSPAPLALPGGGGQSDGCPPSKTLPRGSLLDLSV